MTTSKSLARCIAEKPDKRDVKRLAKMLLRALDEIEYYAKNTSQGINAAAALAQIEELARAV